ncbi:TlpA family protein disulfide reductase [Nocardioides acrostichi]|uniref:TlpA family protein disulfide reductase n=1 Tax=Nocardioides acrostichi TaxID=2784339 RepID=A0A930V034_9ACTN|nr:TlpA disulfide reductase family protein [Nocardioides acrostichi]MBF4163226.1 TlpA family protein disulfide reductase [Nocardioides acrostichi]
MTRPGRLLALLAGAVLMAGCTSTPESPIVGEAKVSVDSPDLRQAKKQAGVEDCPAVTAGAVDGGLPDVTLPCLGGGRDVDMAGLRGPMMINFWAATCGPCREEMPALEDFHQRYGDQVPIIGVDYLDVLPVMAMELVRKTGVTYPLVADPGGDLGADGTLRLMGLPHFVLIDADGKVVYETDGGFDSVDQLVQLVDEHLGVEL